MYNLCNQNVHLCKCIDAYIYCKQISRVECPAWHVIHPMDTAFAPEICHYSHKMDLGINLDPVCWTEVGLLQQHLSVTFWSITIWQGFRCLARKADLHSLSTKRQQRIILQLHILSSLKGQLPFSKRTFQWVSHKALLSIYLDKE